MGDLFSYPIYEFDKIILQHTQKTISNINCKYILLNFIFQEWYMIKKLMKIA